MTKEEIKANEEANRLIDIFGNIRLAVKCVDEIIKTLEGMKLVFSDRKFVLKEWQSVKQILESK